MALHRATDRTTILTIGSEGRHQMTCRYEGWVQYRSRPIRPRVDFRPLADVLTATEPDDAVWLADPPSNLTPQLETRPSGPPSAIEVPHILASVEDHLRQAPAAWNPYALATWSRDPHTHGPAGEGPLLQGPGTKSGHSPDCRP